MYSLLASLISALIAVMVYLNGELAGHLGNAASSVVIHLSGLVLVALLMLLTRANPFAKAVPPVLLGGGALGFFAVVCANVGVMGLGVSFTLALGLLGQTVAALAIDQLGWLGSPVVPFDRRKLGSVALIVAGIAAMAWF